MTRDVQMISDFVTFTTSGSTTIVAVDQDGSGSAYSAQNIATLNGYHRT